MAGPVREEPSGGRGGGPGLPPLRAPRGSRRDSSPGEPAAPPGAPVDVPPQYGVTFKPGKEMEERVRKLTPTPEDLAALEAETEQDEGHAEADGSNGVAPGADGQAAPKKKRPRKAPQP